MGIAWFTPAQTVIASGSGLCPIRPISAWGQSPESCRVLARHWQRQHAVRVTESVQARGIHGDRCWGGVRHRKRLSDESDSAMR